MTKNNSDNPDSDKEDSFAKTLFRGYRNAFNSAENLSKLVLLTEATAAILSLMTMFSSSLTYAVAAAGLFLTLLSWYIKSKASAFKELGERGRRAFVLVNSLAFRIVKKERTDLLGLFPDDVTEPDGTCHKTYYASTLDPGPERLLENIQESAFWTKHLTKDATGKEIAMIALLLICAIIILLTSVTQQSSDTRIQLAQVSLLLFALLFTREHVGRAIAFNNAHNETALMEQRLEKEGFDSFSEHEKMAKVALILGDYNALLSSTPVLNNTLHKRKKEQLNKLWDERSH